MDRESIRSRLQQLVDTHTQAEIARRTAAAPPAIHRYLHGAKVPADFCAALVKEFGVNPAWLLTGEGAPYLSDVSAGTQRMAGDLLALVNAMNHVARMRLGSLVGKHHLKVLRELNDAMLDYERLRVRMDEHTAPFFQQALADYRVAVMERKDLHRADALRAVVAQLGRLNQDVRLQRNMLSLMAYHEYLRGTSDAGIDLMRQAYRLRMSMVKEFDDYDADEARSLALVLNQNGRRQEAAAVANSALHMLRLRPDLDDYARQLELICAILDVDAGTLHGKASLIADLYGRVPQNARVALSGALVRVLLFTDSVRLQAANAIGEPGRGRALQVVRFALLDEGLAALQFAQAHAIGSPDHAVAPDDPHAAQLLALLDAANGKPAALASQMKAAAQLRDTAGSNKARFDAAAACSQAARVSAPAATARKHALAAEYLRMQMPPGVTPDLLDLAIHFRAAIELPPSTTAEWQEFRAQANKFFNEHVQQGYACFKRWAARNAAAEQ